MAFSVLALLLLTAQTPAPAPQGAPTIAAAQARLAAGDAAGAKAILEKVVQATPTAVRAWNALGTACQQLKDADCAVAAFTRTLDLRATDYQTMFNLGVSYALKGDADAAFLWLGKARTSKRVDMTQMEGNAALDLIRKDARFAALVPTPGDFADPFVEPTKIVGEWSGEAANDGFGWIARNIGDVDGDKADDFVTSSPGSAINGANSGRVYVYSSKRGYLLWKADGAAGDRLGAGIEAAGDVNGDGAGDVVASAPTGGYARVYSGRDGSVLLTLKPQGPGEAFGRHASGAGDVNGDGVPDVVIGAPGGGPQTPATFPGRAYVFSGKDGALLQMLTGERAGDQFGSAVSGSSRNGKITLLVGAAAAGPAKTGRTYVYHALGQTPAFTFDADETGAAFGAMFVGVPGDLDGDDVDDIYISDWPNSAKGPSTGRVYVHSGKTGRRVYTFTGETAGDGFGTTQATAGDVDGDGTPDLVVGAWQYGGAAIGGGRIYLYSGKTGGLLKMVTCRIPGETFGFDAVGLGDVDGDGTVDLLVTSGYSGIKGFHSGRVFIVSSGIRKAR